MEQELVASTARGICRGQEEEGAENIGCSRGVEVFGTDSFVYKMLMPMGHRLARATMVFTVPSHGIYHAMVTPTLGIYWLDAAHLRKEGFPLRMIEERAGACMSR